MSQPNPYESPTLEHVAHGLVSWKEIGAHLTKTEQRKFNIRGALYGVWCAISLAIPIQLAVMAQFFDTPYRKYWPIAFVFILAHLSYLPAFRTKQRRMLAETEYATAQGIEPDQIDMSPFAKSWKAA